jgi:hypothetical protein
MRFPFDANNPEFRPCLIAALRPKRTSFGLLVDTGATGWADETLSAMRSDRSAVKSRNIERCGMFGYLTHYFPEFLMKAH